MKRTAPVLLPLAVLFIILLAPASAAAPLGPDAAPSVVSYQGQVKVGGATFDGTGFFKFAIVNQAGSTTYWSNDGTLYGAEPGLAVSLTVSNGLFNVLLGDTSLGGGITSPLTSEAFTGADRFLRVWFSSSGSAGTFILLSPNRRIAAVPYALRVEKEQNLVIVAKSGGDFTSIQAALNSITDASAANPYLIRVGPGVYDGRVVMKSWVDIEGSGELATKLTYTCIASAPGTLNGADNAEVRFLTIEAKGASCDVVAVENSGQSPRLTHVTLLAETIGGNVGNSVVALRTSSAAPVLNAVTIQADAKSSVAGSYGIQNTNSAAVMTQINVTVMGG